MIFNGFLNFAVLFRVSPVRVSSFRVSLWDAFQELLDTDANEPDDASDKLPNQRPPKTDQLSLKANFKVKIYEQQS